MVGKRLVNTGAEAAFDPLQNFETVTYTGNGSTQKITGYIRKGAAFNGSSSFVALPFFNFVSGSSANFTASLWFNVTDMSGGNNLIQLSGSSSTNSSFNVQLLPNGTFRIDSYGVGHAFSGLPTVSTNNWYNLVLVNAGGTCTPYLNGSAGDVLTHNINFSGSYSNLGARYVSGSLYTPDITKGSIDQVRIFNTALSSSEVTTLYNEDYDSSTKSTTDIFGDGSGVALYELDEDANDTGTVASTVDTVDIFGDNSLTDYYKLDGVFTNEKSGGTLLQSGSSTFGDGILGQALYLSGTQTASQTSTSYGSMNITGSYTMSCYFKATTGGKRNIIWYVDNIGGVSSIVEFGSDNKLYFGWAGASGAFVTSNTYSANTWYHLAVSVNASTGAIVGYVNGQSVGSGTGNTSTGSTQCFGHGAVGLTGYIDQVRIFNKIISDSEAATLYEVTSYNGIPTNINFLGMAFQPDFVWVKTRDRGYPFTHRLTDSVRGATKQLSSDTTDNEVIENGVLSFDSNGFTLGNSAGFNISGDNFVAWCWKAADTTTTIAANTVGNTIASDVRANQDAGFSIVSYTGNSVQGATVGHGLSSAPELIIAKSRSTSTSSWRVGATPIGWQYYMNLDGTSQAYVASSIWNSTTPTSSVFSLGNNADANGNGETKIAYCFHSVDGYQKVGNFVADNQTTKNIFTGFRPRFLLLKRTNSAQNWVLVDSLRSNNELYANTSGSDATEASIPTFYDDGFTLHNTRYNGGTDNYIYLAIA